MLNNYNINPWKKILSLFICIFMTSCSQVEEPKVNSNTSEIDSNNLTCNPSESSKKDEVNTGVMELDEATLAIIEIVKEDCSYCHPSQIQPDLTSDENIIAAKADIIRTVKNGTMPKETELTSERKEAILAWEQVTLTLADPTSEALENSASVTYEGWVKGYIASNCLSCHPTTDANPMSNFAETSETAERALEAMKNGSMPPDYAALPEDVNKFELWVNGGKPLDADSACP